MFLPLLFILYVWFPSINGLILTHLEKFNFYIVGEFPSINGLILTNNLINLKLNIYIVSIHQWSDFNKIGWRCLLLVLSRFHPSMV